MVFILFKIVKTFYCREPGLAQESEEVSQEVGNLITLRSHHGLFAALAAETCVKGSHVSKFREYGATYA